VIEFVEIGIKMNDEFKDRHDPSYHKLGYCTAKVASWFIPEAQVILKQWRKKIQVRILLYLE
jgi:hypothetical protein